jgi:hypothetical protein
MRNRLIFIFICLLFSNAFIYNPFKNKLSDFRSLKASPRSLQQISKEKIAPFFILGSLPLINIFLNQREVAVADDLLPTNLPELKSDEFAVTINSDVIGIGLVEKKYKDRIRVFINSIKDDLADPSIQQNVKPKMILIGVNQEPVEGFPIDRVFTILKQAPRPLVLRFRDPLRFFQLLSSYSNSDISRNQIQRISTTIIPQHLARDGYEQVLLIDLFPNLIGTLPPPQQQSSQSAGVSPYSVEQGDVVELLYSAKLVPSPSLSCSTAGAEPSEFSNAIQIDGVNDISNMLPTINRSILRNNTVFFVVGNKKSQKYNVFSTSSTPTTIPNIGTTAEIIDNRKNSDPLFGKKVGGILNYVIADWDQFLVGMHVNERRRLYFPPAYYQNAIDEKFLESYQEEYQRRQVNDDVKKTQRPYLCLDVSICSINGNLL